MFVAVRENNVDQALRVLKKKMQREGLFREMKIAYISKSHLSAAHEKQQNQHVACASLCANV